MLVFVVLMTDYTGLGLIVSMPPYQWSIDIAFDIRNEIDIFHIKGSVQGEIYANNCPTRCNYIQFNYVCKPLYMFRVVFTPIIRSSCHCTHSIWR